MPRKAKLPDFVLEWRQAPVCHSSCSVCNLIDSSSQKEEQTNRLDLNQSIRIIGEFGQMIKRWRFSGVIRISGGNYREYDDFLELAKFINDKDIDLEIMGCPCNLEPILDQLKNVRIRRISLFLYGIGDRHDSFKYPNDFSDTLRVYKTCREYRLPTQVIFLLNRNFYENPEELEDIANLIRDEKLAMLEFQRFPYLYNYNQPQLKLTAREFYTVMFSLFQQYMRSLRDYISEDNNVIDHESLWALLFQTLGMNYYQPEEQGIIHSGCKVGSGKISVRADGVVYPCLRLPLKIGQVPEENLRDIFINSQVLNRMREIDNFEYCKKCDLAQLCRGCPGIAYQDTNHYLGKDPHCWKTFAPRRGGPNRV